MGGSDMWSSTLPLDHGGTHTQTKQTVYHQIQMHSVQCALHYGNISFHVTYTNNLEYVLSYKKKTRASDTARQGVSQFNSRFYDQFQNYLFKNKWN